MFNELLYHLHANKVINNNSMYYTNDSSTKDFTLFATVYLSTYFKRQLRI